MNANTLHKRTLRAKAAYRVQLTKGIKVALKELGEGHFLWADLEEVCGFLNVELISERGRAKEEGKKCRMLGHYFTLHELERIAGLVYWELGIDLTQEVEE